MSVQEKRGFNEERVLSVCTGPEQRGEKKNEKEKNSYLPDQIKFTQ
jgi:hypothetical protein